MAMYDAIAYLINDGTRAYDGYGNETITTTSTMVYVQPRSVYQSEFYNASQLGLSPTVALFIANKADYAGQKEVLYDGQLYDVIRVDWKSQKDGITLTLDAKKNGEANA